MKKEIIVNASKDRSRIAILEDGELVELYVEHPDNVRTLGNIYLARVRKVMPAIRAAFVDIGQKQDAFLHFSDLTDNLGELLAISGEKVPGYEKRVLATAPRKRVADDEDEPDIEETLELEASEASEDEASRSRRSSRSRGRNRSRGRGRRGRSSSREEEEEQEEVSDSDGSPFVIDLTFKPGRVNTPAEREQRTVGREDRRKASTTENAEESKQRDAESDEEPSSPVPVIDLTTSGGEQDSRKARAASDSETSRRRGRRGRRRGEQDHANDKPRRDDSASGDQAQAAESVQSKKDQEDSRARDDRREGGSRQRGGSASSDRRRGGSNSGKKANADGKSESGRREEKSKQPPSARPEELLKRDQRLLVKVTKEPISSKGSRVSTDISFAGRFLVLVPAADYVAVSKKIASGRERRRLRAVASELKPDGFGVIVRTVAEERDAKTLDTDMRLLVDKWRKIEKQLAERPDPPQLLYEDVNMVSSIIRDLFTDDFDRILVDDPKLHRNIQAYVGAVAPHMAERVKLHRSNAPVFRTMGIERSVEEVFSPRVALPSGGYLFIEHTEAMHVVDVNSGRAGRGKTQAENLLSVNLEAAHEVARQLRLRDLGGIIVVDFIDMWRESDRRKVYQTLKKEFKKDRAVTKLLPMSDFGLIQITRQRLRPSITATVENGDADNPQSAMAAAGASEIKQPERNFGPERLDKPQKLEDLISRLDTWLRHYRANVPNRYRNRPISVRVHPLLESNLRRGIVSQIRLWKWSLRGLRFDVVEDDSMHPLDFDVADKSSGTSLKTRYEPSEGGDQNNN